MYKWHLAPCSTTQTECIVLCSVCHIAVARQSFISMSPFFFSKTSITSFLCVFVLFDGGYDYWWYEISETKNKPDRHQINVVTWTVWSIFVFLPLYFNHDCEHLPQAAHPCRRWVFTFRQWYHFLKKPLWFVELLLTCITMISAAVHN